MGKKYIIYANGKDLAQVHVTQNEVGKYYRNSSGTYFTPILADFDTAKPPAGYLTYYDGSHLKYKTNPNRNPIDFSIIAGTNLTMNVDVNILGSNPKDGSWCKIQPVWSDLIIALVHTYQWRTGLVKAGNIICKIAPQSVTGFAPHLHLDEWSGNGRMIRYLILNGDYNMNKFKKGDKVIITGVQNIRKGPAGEITGDSVIGQTGFIYDNPREAVLDGVNYTWYDIHIDGGGSGWFADVGKFEIYEKPETPPITPPETPNYEEYIKQIETLKQENSSLAEALEKSKNDTRLARERVAYLEGLVEEYKASEKSLADKVNNLEQILARLEKEKGELEYELSQLKNNKMIIEDIFDWINKLLKQIFGRK